MGAICSSCGLWIRELTPGYSSRRRHMETRGTFQVSNHYGACSHREGFLVLLSSHGGRRFVTRIVPSHVPTEDGSTDNGLGGGARLANDDDERSISYQDQEYGQNPHPMTEAILSTTCLRQPGAKIVHWSPFRRKIVSDGPRLVVLHLRNHTEPLPELITTLHALRQQRFFFPSSQDWLPWSEFDGTCFHRSSENGRNRSSRGLQGVRCLGHGNCRRSTIWHISRKASDRSRDRGWMVESQCRDVGGITWARGSERNRAGLGHLGISERIQDILSIGIVATG